MGYGLWGKADVAEKPKTLFSRFRSRCVLVSVTLVFWWALVMVQYFSFHRRPPPLQSLIGQPLRSLQTQEAKPRGLPTDSCYEAHTRSAGVLSGSKVRQDQQRIWHKDREGKVDGELSFGEGKPLENAAAGYSEDDHNSFVEQPVQDCEGRYIYVYDLDPYFNDELVTHCDKFLWKTMCSSVANAGLGQPLNNTDGVFSDSDWYKTNQFMLELIFHNRMRQYKCLTRDSSQAEAVFVPFYAGFEITTKLWGANVTERDAAPERLFGWLARRAEWKRFNGHDHFLVGGRITWDFRRSTDEESDWGNKLLVSPPGLNMTMLAIEASPWHDNDFAIPYPTYFHPSSKSSILHWQDRMRAMKRRSLFSFIGAPRPWLSYSIRGKIIEQCRNSSFCRLLDCRGSVCSLPEKVMEVFEHSIFCLQPPGDSYTRRSTFDAMLAGCIPVFFHRHSAYAQYDWHLPANHSSYSVLIEEGFIKNDTIRIEQVLLKFLPEQIASMREMVIRAIPRLVYADPRLPSPMVDVEDAFDIAVQGVIARIAKWKRNTRDGTMDSTTNHLKSQSKTEETLKEEAATQEAMKKSEKRTGWREKQW